MMPKSYPIFLSIFLFFLLLSCSDSVSDLNTKDISVSSDGEYLEIRNHFNHPIYYFAVESGIAAAIQWAPISSKENLVKSRSTKRISLDKIYAFESGDVILFYYWSKKEPGNKNIKFQRVETK